MKGTVCYHGVLKLSMLVIFVALSGCAHVEGMSKAVWNNECKRGANCSLSELVDAGKNEAKNQKKLDKNLAWRKQFREIKSSEMMLLIQSCLPKRSKPSGYFCSHHSDSVIRDAARMKFGTPEKITQFKQRKVIENVLAVSGTMHDKGIFIDKSLNFEGTVILQPDKGVRLLWLDKVYSGTWEFSRNFRDASTNTALLWGAASPGVVKAMAGVQKNQKQAVAKLKNEGKKWALYSKWGKAKKKSGKLVRSAVMICDSGHSFEVQEHSYNNGKVVYERNSGDILLPQSHKSLYEFAKSECPNIGRSSYTS